MGLEEFIDVDQVGPVPGLDHQIQVMVLGLPPALGHGDGGDVEVVVLIALVAGVEVEDIGAQTQRRQQPRLQIVELRAARRRAGSRSA
jgi:excinuclease ABC subunit B